MKSDKYEITQQQAKAQFWENSLFLSPNPLSFSKCKAVTNYFAHTSKKEKEKKSLPWVGTKFACGFCQYQLSCLPPHKFQKQLRFGKLQICKEH